MLTPDELVKREADLVRNESAWKNTKVNLERECLKIKAEIEQLIPERDSLQEDIKTNGAQVAALVTAQTDIKRDNEAKVAESDRLDTQIKQSNTELEQLESSIQQRKDNADIEVTNYANKKREMMTQSWVELQEKIDSAKELLLKDDSAHTERVNGIEALKQQHKDLKATIKTATSEANQLRTKIGQLKTTLKALSEEHSSLNGTVTQTRAELATATQKHEEFKIYEKKAWAALNAMDESLQGRLTEVERLEQFAANKQSFLPPRE